MSSTTNTSDGGVETLAKEEARLTQELAELQRPQKILKLKAQIEAARKGTPSSDEHDRSCCLTILRAEEQAHGGTRAQLDQKTLELDNLKVEFSAREKELATIKSKLKQVEDELKIMTQAREKEQTAHNQTKASLKTMAELKDQERTAHNKTNTSLKAMAGLRDQEQTAHHKTQVLLETVTQARDKEQAAHEQARATLKTVTDARDQEQTAHALTKAALTRVTGLLDLEQAAHNQTKTDLKAMTASRDEQQTAQRRTEADLEAMTELRNQEKIDHDNQKKYLRVLEADNDAKDEQIRDLENSAARAVPSLVRDIRFQDGYPKAEGSWTLLNESYKINHKGDIVKYEKKGGKSWIR
ncbi:hypothetical protein AYL99_01957 [Fonsecaea erecta]|uniref:Uncharacterized protein n=1 Tax=Fonsecaea erecta TaxID=1367422 RepID=A0A178ZSC7_9EURO|nr:hypothetical protein AYL99_01957 [Fonsecaea erecta]OAP62730.1 hypothetical protein AYL99_01957 [Fonsecaea erecta]